MSTFRPHDLYRAHLAVEGSSPELQNRIADANAFVKEALIVRWEAGGNKGIPTIDVDGSLSAEVRCFIARFPT